MATTIAAIGKALELSAPQLQAIREAFGEEIQRAAAAEQSQISYLKTVLPDRTRLSPTDKLQVVAIGGSNFHTALVTGWQSGKPQLGEVNKLELPTFPTRESFLAFIGSQLDPQTGVLALNFAYPLKSELRDNRLDARLLEATKFNDFTGLVGKLIGEELENYLLSKLGRVVRVSVANDTVCLLLAARAAAPHADLAAVVIGTGFNIALATGGSALVNTEAGDFERFPHSPALDLLRNEGGIDGRASVEKEVAGGYLFRHYNFWAERLEPRLPHVHSTAEVSQLAAAGSELAQILIKRSAQLVGAVLAGLYDYQSKQNPQLKLDLAIEGSLFWDGWQYQTIVADSLKTLGISENQLIFTKLERSYLIGPALLFN
jgi:hexokinase